MAIIDLHRISPLTIILFLIKYADSQNPIALKIQEKVLQDFSIAKSTFISIASIETNTTKDVKANLPKNLVIIQLL